MRLTSRTPTPALKRQLQRCKRASACRAKKGYFFDFSSNWFRHFSCLCFLSPFAFSARLVLSPCCTLIDYPIHPPPVELLILSYSGSNSSVSVPNRNPSPREAQRSLFPYPACAGAVPVSFFSNPPHFAATIPAPYRYCEHALA